MTKAVFYTGEAGYIGSHLYKKRAEQSFPPAVYGKPQLWVLTLFLLRITSVKIGIDEVQKKTAPFEWADHALAAN